MLNTNSKLVYAESTPNTNKMGELIDFTSLPKLQEMVEQARRKSLRQPKNVKAKAAERKLRDLAEDRENFKKRLIDKVKSKLATIEERIETRRQLCEEPKVTPRREKGELKGWSVSTRINGNPLSRYFAVKKYGKENSLLFAETARLIFLRYIDYYCKNGDSIVSDFAFTWDLRMKVDKIPFDQLKPTLTPKPRQSEKVLVEKKEILKYFSARYIDIPRASMVLIVKAIEGMSELEKLELVHSYSKSTNMTSYKFSYLTVSSRESLVIEIESE